MKNMKRSITMLIVLLAALASVFAGGEKEAAAEGPVEIEIWSALKGNKQKTLDSQIAQFNASQDDIVVTCIPQGGQAILRQKVAAAVGAGNMPEMITCDYLDVAYYAQLGLLQPITDALSEEVIADYYPAMLADLMYDGELYALPYNRSTQGFFVNNDLLRKAGIDHAATTWDEFREHAEKMKELGDDYYYGYAFFHQFLFDGIAYTWGADISTPDGEVRLDSPEMVEMMSYFQKMYQDGLLLMQPVLVGGFEEQNGAFLDGKVATVFQTSSFMPTAEAMLKYDWSFEFVPAGKGGNAITIGGNNFAITSQAGEREVEAAKKFLEFMSSPELAVDFFLNTGNLPTRRSTMDDPEMQKFLLENPDYARVVEQLEFGKAAPSTTKNIRDVFNRVNDMISRIILSGEDVKSVLSLYDREFQAEFDELKANGEFIY